jgi:ABC-type phosphate/phosphonate transport system substrate-binding protein
MTPIAALPMYDFPALRQAHAQLWSAVADRLERLLVRDVPRHLTWGLAHQDTWRHPGLLFGQACEYPLAKRYRRQLQVVATPSYGAPGCTRGTYCSAILVRAGDRALSLDDLRARVCVVNEPDSNSGMNLLRAALAPRARVSRFFGSTYLSHSHHRSLVQVAAGKADVTAVDCVTLAHLSRFEPALIAQVRILDWTPSSPCLPFVTSHLTTDATVQALRTALADVMTDASLGSMRETLLLDGMVCDPNISFERVEELEGFAERHGYHVLC